MRRTMAITITALAAGLTFAGAGTAGAGGGCHNDVFSDEETSRVELSRNCYEPTVVRLQPGQQVTWINEDPTAHTVTGVANTWGGDNKVYEGESVTYQFDEAGVFPYFCFFHPSMVGAVVVGDGRAASTGAADGGVKAVSAQIAGGQADGADRDAMTETDDRDTTIPLVIGVGVLAAMTGFVGAFVLRRKSEPEE